jgi:hypothetical protein
MLFFIISFTFRDTRTHLWIDFRIICNTEILVHTKPETKWEKMIKLLVLV